MRDEAVQSIKLILQAAAVTRPPMSKEDKEDYMFHLRAAQNIIMAVEAEHQGTVAPIVSGVRGVTELGALGVTDGTTKRKV